MAATADADMNRTTCLTRVRIEGLLEDNAAILSLPEVCIRVQMLADDPEAEMEEFARVVAQDPAFTAQLLKRVNSAYYGFPGRVATVSRAVGLIGIQELRKLSLAMAAVEVFRGQPLEGYDMLSFWRHGVFTALVAQVLARRAGVLHAERLFIAGLLHDIGHLVIFTRLPQAAAGLGPAVLAHAPDLCEQEHARLGWDHAALGGELLRRWQLPEELCAAAGYHHAPLAAGTGAREAALVALANHIAHSVEQQSGTPGGAEHDPYTRFIDIEAADTAPVTAALANLPEGIWRQAGVTVEAVPEALQLAGREFDGLLQLLYGF